MAKNITPREKNFSEWYQDTILAGKLADYSPVRGCMIIRPTGYSLWEKMQSILDRMFKETGHTNAYFPLLIPQSFINKEQHHIEGFSPELAVVTHAGGEKLEEPLVIRPTSETIVGNAYSKWVKSYRDLPILINQWCNVMRWEMRTRMFLRTSEFLWQEGHTVHETKEEAEQETQQMLEIYRVFLEDYCAIALYTGKKPEHEKFPGALATYTLEALMQDGKALQSGTSHNLGQNFAKVFNIQFLDRNNQQAYGWTTSWGVSTRLIGGVIMVHSDDDGLIIPPKIAPHKVVIVSIIKDKDKEQIMSYISQVENILYESLGKLSVIKDTHFNQRISDRYFYWIQQGIPIRIEVGIKDMEKGTVALVRRDSRKKIDVKVSDIAAIVNEQLDELQKKLYQKSATFLVDNTHTPKDYVDMKNILSSQRGFIKAYWDGTKETAQKIQEETKATIRLIFPDIIKEKNCIYSGKEARYQVLFAQAY